MYRSAISLALLATLSGVATAQEQPEAPAPKRKEVSIAVNVGGFFPLSGTTQDRFGSTWFDVGASLFDRAKPERWQFSFDLGILNNRDLGEATLIPVTAGVQRAFASGRLGQPYVALRVGPYYGKVEGDRLPAEGETVGFNANAAVGVVIRKRYSLELRYDTFSRFARTRFDGLTLSAGVRVFDFKL